MTRIRRKFDNMVEAMSLYLKHPEGLSDIELAKALNIDRSSAFRLRHEFDVRETERGHFTIDPCESLIELARLILARTNK